MQTLRQDLAYALRQMRLSPVFTLTAMLTLALGIGATTAIFSLINTVMLKSLPVADPASLYRIGDGRRLLRRRQHPGRMGLLLLRLLPAHASKTPPSSPPSPPSRPAAGPTASAVAKPIVPPSLSAANMSSGNYFSTFGLDAFAGRTITPADDQPNSPPVAMLSYRTWQQQYGSDPSIVGSTFILDDHPVTIIGITPPGFFGETLRANPPELWLPLNQEPVFSGPSSLLQHFRPGSASSAASDPEPPPTPPARA